MRRMLGLTLGLAAVGALALTPLASASAAKRPAHQANAADFTVLSFGNNSLVPAPGTNPKRPSPGDVIVLNGHLTLPTPDDGRYEVIGHDSGSCTITRVGRRFGGLANCVITAVLPNGKISAAGELEFARHTFSLETSHLAITGGTGAYRSADGVVQVMPGKKATALTFKVR